MMVFRSPISLSLTGLMLLCVFSCKMESYRPIPKAEIVTRQVEHVLVPGSGYELDVDSNGVTDYRLFVYTESTTSRSKAIFRVEGTISDLLTNVVHGTLRELSVEQQCDVPYPSVLEAGILGSSETVGENLDYDWWVIGDFHHNDYCYGSNCDCPGPDPDVEYVPINNGSLGYIGLRFVRNARRHYAWIEVERISADEPQYKIRRVSWRRTAGAPILIEN